jgi:hypothetical protein
MCHCRFRVSKCWRIDRSARSRSAVSSTSGSRCPPNFNTRQEPGVGGRPVLRSVPTGPAGNTRKGAPRAAAPTEISRPRIFNGQPLAPSWGLGADHPSGMQHPLAGQIPTAAGFWQGASLGYRICRRASRFSTSGRHVPVKPSAGCLERCPSKQWASRVPGGPLRLNC